jgi:Ni,Fe-hydrogenase III large subunit
MPSEKFMVRECVRDPCRVPSMQASLSQGISGFRWPVSPSCNSKCVISGNIAVVEKLFEQQQLTEAVPLSERVSGDTSVGHSLAYCQAVEMLQGVEVSPRARYLRTLFLELERLHNHIGDVGAICNDTAYALAHAHCGRMKEQLMQLNDRLTGSRFLRGVNCIGGVTLDLSSLQLAQVEVELNAP